jgi:alkylhydroperoxidase family enzyme
MDHTSNASNLPRITPVPESALGPPALVQAIAQRRGGTLLNLDRMLLRSPVFASGWNGFMGAIRTQLSLDPCLRELAICMVAVETDAAYEWSQHAPEFLAAGGSQAQLDALQGDKPSSNTQAFNATERAVLALALRLRLGDAPVILQRTSADARLGASPPPKSDGAAA